MAFLPLIKMNHKTIRNISDISKLAELVFPSSKLRQYCFVCIVTELKNSNGLIPDLNTIRDKYGLSQRTFERTRANMRKLGLIDYVSGIKHSYATEGWSLSNNYFTSLNKTFEFWMDWKGRKDTFRDEVEVEIAKSRASRVD